MFMQPAREKKILQQNQQQKDLHSHSEAKRKLQRRQCYHIVTHLGHFIES